MHAAFLFEQAVSALAFHFERYIAIAIEIIFVLVKNGKSKSLAGKKLHIHIKKHARKIFGIIAAGTGNYRHDGAAFVEGGRTFFFLLQFAKLANGSLGLVFI